MELMKIKCPKPDCAYEWDYKGHHAFYITCPRCLRKFKVPKPTQEEK